MPCFCGIIRQEGLAWLGMLGVGVSWRRVGQPMMGPCKSKALFFGLETRTLSPLVSPVSYWVVSLFSTDILLPAARCGIFEPVVF
jgi:hypothetical protein